jgi:pimeloyl-ACP methyl ester carboxylesterase
MDEITEIRNKINRERIERGGTLLDYPVEIDGGKVMNLNIQGSNNPDDQIVILLPGSGVKQPTEDFDLLIDQLKSGCKVITVEPFGSGLSDPPDEDGKRELDEDLHAALDMLKKTKTIPEHRSYTIVAHSKGGGAAMRFAINHPEEVEGFVGIDAYMPGQDAVLREMGIPIPNETGLPEDASLRFPDSVRVIHIVPDYLEKPVDGDKGGAPGLIDWRRQRLTPASNPKTDIVASPNSEHFAHHTQPALIAEQVKMLHDKQLRQS